MTDCMKRICGSLSRLSDDDLIALSDAAVAERKRRGLYQLQSGAPMYLRDYQKAWRARQKERNGPNVELRAFRERHGLSQGKLGEILNLPNTRISAYECGVLKTPDWVMEFIREEDAHGTL